MSLTIQNNESLDSLPLLQGIAPEKINSVLECYGANLVQFEKGEKMNASDMAQCLYMISGRAQLISTDENGVNSILYEYSPLEAISPEEIFGEERMLRLDVRAAEPTTAITLNITHEVRQKKCCLKYITQLQNNLIASIIKTNTSLVERLAIVAKRSTREKVLALLCEESDRQGNRSFTLPYSHQELADLLYVERSALSRELSKLREEGYITYQKNDFTILKEK